MMLNILEEQNENIHIQIESLFSLARKRVKGLTVEISKPDPITLCYKIAMESQREYIKSGGTLMLNEEMSNVNLGLLKREIKDAQLKATFSEFN